MSAVLEVADLHVDFGSSVAAVRGVSLTVERGQTHCVVGESGCGKSVSALAVMNLLARGGRRRAGRLRFLDTDLLSLSERRMAALRGDRMAMIFQEPMTSLNPAYTIGSQMTEVFRRHRGGSRARARDRAAELLGRVGISAPGVRLGQYPHQLSGGLRQRAMIATALLCEPELLIADEPTTALDVTLQAQILHLLAELQRELGLALLLITHDLGVVARIAHHVSVMYAGEVVETASAAQLFARPLHPYTKGLLASVPVPGKVARDQPLGSIPGVVPRIAPGFSGCGFRDRCTRAEPSCAVAVPRQDAGGGHAYACRLRPDEAAPSPPVDATARSTAAKPAPRARAAPVERGEDRLIDIKGLSKRFDLPGPLFGPRRELTAVDDISLSVPSGGVLGVVGESGCGKSTLSKLILGLLAPSAGEVRIGGLPLAALGRRERARVIQPVFQDPVGSLNPRRRVGEVVGLPLVAQGGLSARAIADRVATQLARVGLAPDMADRFPRELSGGQRQRVAIARALVLEPRIVVCDEPTSALDVSVQAQILNLLAKLRRDLGLTYVFISHNLAVVEHIATEVAVMYLGRIVEHRPVEAVFRAPRHPYTKALLASVLTPEPGLGVPEVGLGEAGPDPSSPPPGCRFHPRCALAIDRCRVEVPPLTTVGGGLVACHLAGG
ncbi:peptide/nickel transport system ATP-binding protein [Rhizobiales bacterium GAS191]|nr:peptide/nickel transport system ATP-binding protein [Rhizobiales bacterium GAS113]SED76579.1 peptide/nickel transport system ATP-binding protein [Rhizobiales bacterium GAS191]